jgi:hypothetical protein
MPKLDSLVAIVDALADRVGAVVLRLHRTVATES